MALLFAAFTHAAWNAVVKSSGDRLLSMATIMVTGAVVMLPVMIVIEPPAPEAWPFLAGAILLHCAYYASLVYAYRFGDLSTTYPIARGAAPMLVAVGAAWFADQTLSSTEMLGVVLVSAGICMFALEKGMPRRDGVKSLLSALSVSLLIGGYMVVDGLGLRRTPDALAYIAWLFVLDGLLMFFGVIAFRGRAYITHLRTYWRREIAGGLLSVIAYTVVLYILAFSGMAFVSALRETSVLFAVAIGTWRLGEKFGPYRWCAAFIVTAGIIIMSLTI